MSILLDKKNRVIVQGITGNEGAFHTRAAIEYGTNIVGGVTPGKGGQFFDGKVPVFNTVEKAVEKTGADTSLLFVPAPFAKDAIMEAADSGIKLIIAITEGIPVSDMIYVKKFVKEKGAILIGPNCPGVISPGKAKAGIMPAFIHKEGTIGVLSRSGTLTYEAVSQIGIAGLGQSTCVGIGGDPIIGSSFVDMLKLFEEDDETEAVVLIGEIGGDAEIEAAKYIENSFTKPVISFIAGKTAPAGRRMGHAGAIISGGNDTAEAKIEVLENAGVKIAKIPSEISLILKEIFS